MSLLFLLHTSTQIYYAPSLIRNYIHYIVPRAGLTIMIGASLVAYKLSIIIFLTDIDVIVQGELVVNFTAFPCKN